MARMFAQRWDKADHRGMADMQASGVQMAKADAAFVKAVSDETAPLIDAWIKAAEAKGMKEPKKALAEPRAKVARAAELKGVWLADIVSGVWLLVAGLVVALALALKFRPWRGGCRASWPEGASAARAATPAARR